MSDQTKPRTYRDVLLPIVGAEALQEAEARVYDRHAPDEAAGVFMCAEGCCALGVMHRVLHPDNPNPFPIADDLIDYDLYGHDVWLIGGDIIGANDCGELATPGALTALLDSPLEVR